jgi:membrane fusion protein (multidrug efflux system)
VNTRLNRFLWILLLAAAVATFTGCGAFVGAFDGSGKDEETQEASASDDSAESADAESEDREGEDGGDEEGDDDEEAEEQAVPVEVSELQLGAIESVIKSSATLEAERQVKVFAEANRLVKDLLVEEGNRVRRGQVLVRLQDEAQRNALSRAENELAKADREYARQERLYKQQLISEEAWNDATFNVEQLRISVADAQRELGYTEVKAPIAGTITMRTVNLGDQVNVGQHLFDIVDFDSLVARIYVPEKNLPELRRGQLARVSARATGGREYTGRVNRVAPIVDARSGTVKVTIDVGGRGLLPGMYVDVELVTATRDEAVLVPKRALIYDNDQMYVFRLGEERRVERVFIVPRLSDKHNVEPLDGLSAGDRIVVAGQAGLKDGALVRLPGEDQDETAEGEGDEDEVVERAAA